ncbi:MAG: hypothetical protein JO163_14390 [Methylobacteriaceae bacterium]|nr:hypothetical protein [Methylobacteriaceae bacterium]MBV9703915.1 hypothetical protein [Methylobacteriaceae bacterium]
MPIRCALIALTISFGIASDAGAMLVPPSTLVQAHIGAALLQAARWHHWHHYRYRRYSWRYWPRAGGQEDPDARAYSNAGSHEWIDPPVAGNGAGAQ